MGNVFACCRRRANVDNTGYYALLGVAPTATGAEIDAAFERLKASHDVESAGDETLFLRVVKAYRVLSHPRKRALYDKFGEQEAAHGAGSPRVTTGDPYVYEIINEYGPAPDEGFLAANVPSGLWNEAPMITNRIASDELFLVRLISAGEYGDLWLGQVREAQVAVKQLKKADQNQTNALVFAAEIVRMTQLSHPKIASFVGVEWTKQWATRALAEFLPRGNLRSLLSSSDAAAFDWANFKCQVALDIAEALAYVHAQSDAPGSVLTSRNVLLVGDDGSSKLSLFAAARSRQDVADLSQYLTWVAPEVILGDSWPAAAPAIYSLGVLLCELDTTKPPFFDARNPDGSPMSKFKIALHVAQNKLRPSWSDACPEGIVALIKDCLSFDPRARPTAASVGYRLRDVLKNDL